MATLSLCMIVKDEEDVIRRCLDSVQAVCDEIIVVDTGSKDRTVEIVKSYPQAKVYHFRWIDDFGAARNESFRHATQDLILWLDADDVVKPKDLELLKIMKQKPVDQHADLYLCRYQYDHDADDNVTTSLQRERVLKRSKNPRWLYRIHECIDMTGMSTKLIDLEIHHYKTGTQIKRAEGRNLRILKECVEDPSICNSRYEFYYGKELAEIGKFDEAEKYLERYLERWEFFEDAFFANYYLADIAFHKKEYQRAFNYAFDALKLDQNRAEIFCLLGLIHVTRGRWDLAEFWYKAALQIPIPKENLGFYRMDNYGITPHAQLTFIYATLGQNEKAYEHCLKALELDPDHEMSKHNKRFLGSLLGKRGKSFGVYIPFQYDENNPNIRLRKLNVVEELRRQGFEAEIVQDYWSLFNFDYIISHILLDPEALRRLKAAGKFVAYDFAEMVDDVVERVDDYNAVLCCSPKIKRECEPRNSNAVHIPDSYEIS